MRKSLRFIAVISGVSDMLLWAFRSSTPFFPRLKGMMWCNGYDSEWVAGTRSPDGITSFISCQAHPFFNQSEVCQ